MGNLGLDLEYILDLGQKYNIIKEENSVIILGKINQINKIHPKFNHTQHSHANNDFSDSKLLIIWPKIN